MRQKFWRAPSPIDFRRKKVIRGRELCLKFEYRGESQYWGRFGGGWNWCLGFQAAGSTLIINLLIASLRLSWAKVKEPKQ